MTAIVSSFFQTTGDATGIRVVNSTTITVNTNTINGGHMGSCSGGFWGIHVRNSDGQVDTDTVGGIATRSRRAARKASALRPTAPGTLDISGNLHSLLLT